MNLGRIRHPLRNCEEMISPTRSHCRPLFIRYNTLPLLMTTVVILSLFALSKAMYGSFDMIYAKKARDL